MATAQGTPPRIQDPEVQMGFHPWTSGRLGTLKRVLELHPAALFLALLLVVEACLFAWSFTAFFGSDSIFYLARKLDHPADFFRSLAAPDDRGHYRHLTLALFSFLFYPLFEHNPVGYHAVSLAFHCINTILGYLLLRKILPGKLAAIAASFYFGLHSINAFVSYSIAFLPDLTYVFFALLTLLGFLAYQESRRLGVLVLSACSFALSLLCKETAVALPPLLAVCVLARPDGLSLAERARHSWRGLAIFAAIAVVYVALLLSLKGGRLFPDELKDPYRASFTMSTVVQKARYIWWGLGLPVGTGQLKGHPRAMALLAEIAPESVLPHLGETSNLFLDPKRLLRLILMLPLVIVFAAGVTALWRREPMILGGTVWFVVALVPVLFLAVKTMRHNLYLPNLGIASIMGLAVAYLYECARKRMPRVARVGLAYFFVATFTSTALAVRTFSTDGWPVVASRAAERSLNDLMRLHPKLAPGTTLYFLDNRRDDLVWFFEGGNLFRIFYRDPSLQFLFEQSGDPLPADHAARSDLLVFGYHEEHLYEVTKVLRDETFDLRSTNLLDRFDRARVSLANGSYHLRGFLNTPTESAVFPYRFARGGTWRSALVTIAGARVEFPLPPIKPGSRLRIGVAMVHDLGDGAEGRVVFRSGGRTHEIYSRSLDPAGRPEHRRWFDDVVDLGRFAGQAGDLSFECSPGPSSNTAADWFAWSILKIETK